jgi:galactokinase
VPTP